jgi:PAS domain S-box-containing protein
MGGMQSSKLNSQPTAAAAIAADESRDSGTYPTAAPGDRSRTVAVLSLDLEGKIVGCNDSAPVLLCGTVEHILGKQLPDFISVENKTEHRQFQKTMLDLVLRQGQYESAHIFRTGSGAEFAGRLSVALMRDGRSKSAGIIAILSKDSPDASVTSPVVKPEAEGSKTAQVAFRDISGTKLVLSSPIMHQFMRMVDRVASHSESVLITGETGTGKELIAHSIHQSSSRRNKPWVDINCAALPENLVESELFGYEKGAFTGADSSKPGLFELADKGTLFLDEIGELQLQTQVKLLRVLDGHPFYRLGGHRKIEVDVRIVAATNQDLDAAVAAGRFRQDLFHRLGQFQLRVPPLRERPEDIVALAEHFLALKSPKGSFSPDAISALLSHQWLGNVRELRNLIARVAVESREPEIRKTQITAAMSGNPVAQRQSASMPVGNLDSMEEQMIIRALERSGGHRSQAAEQLGISRRTLSRKLKEYNINMNPGDMVNTL